MTSSPMIAPPSPLSPVPVQAANGTLEFHMAASTSADENGKKMTMVDKDGPDKYLLIIAQFLDGHTNDTNAIDRYNGPVLIASIKNVYWIFLIQYAILAMTGIVMNVTIIAYIVYHRLFKDVTHAFIVNLAFCHFVQCAVVLPISLMVMLIQNWIFGQFLCFFLPMLQDIPLHVAMMTHILIAWDRMRWLGDPLKGRFPAFVCCCATWLAGMVIALPYPIYTIYVEIGDFIPRLNGMGLCVVNLMDDMHEYVRGLFLLMYCAPTVLLAYLYIRTSQELRPPEAPLAVMLYEHRVDIRMRQRNSSASSVDRSYSGATTATIGGTGSGGGGGGGAGGLLSSMAPYSTGTATRSYDLYSAEWDVNREKRNQRNFGSMAAAQVVCLCPLMILRFARLSIEETYENQRHFDFTYLMFVWLAFLPTVIFPCIYASQILPREEQERLRGYFRLTSKRLSNTANKKLAKSCIDGQSGFGGTGGSDGNSPSSKEDSIGKDETTNTQGTTQATSVLSTADGHGARAATNEASRLGHNKASKYQHQSVRKEMPRDGVIRVPPPRHGKEATKMSKRNDYTAGDGGINGTGRDAKQFKRNSESAGGKGGRSLSTTEQQDEVRINIISDGKTKSSTERRMSVVDAGLGRPACLGGGQRKLTLESLDNRSNLTSSTYCNGNSSLLDDGDVSNFGDGEDSSIVSGMVMHTSSNCSSTGLPPYFEKKPKSMSVYSSSGLRGRDMSFDDSSSFSHLDSSSTLAREMEIMDFLERERSSVDMQDLLQRDKNNESTKRREGERRKLPDIEKICHRSPKHKTDSYSHDTSNNTSITSLSAKVPTSTDPLRTTDTYSLSSHLNGDDASLSLPYDKENVVSSTTAQKSSIDEEVPSDFYDSYTPGENSAILPPSSTAVSSAVQYQYSRRLSRKTSHHTTGATSSHLHHHHHNHRMSKRDSFNSLNSSDLIAGAFGELDPTQPLTKMSVIENRVVRRSGSGRTSSFSSSARSSMKSRDYGHGSNHSTHPELDFRENFLADL